MNSLWLATPTMKMPKTFISIVCWWYAVCCNESVCNRPPALQLAKRKLLQSCAPCQFSGDVRPKLTVHSLAYKLRRLHSQNSVRVCWRLIESANGLKRVMCQTKAFRKASWQRCFVESARKILHETLIASQPVLLCDHSKWVVTTPNVRWRPFSSVYRPRLKVSEIASITTSYGFGIARLRLKPVRLATDANLLLALWLILFQESKRK